MPAVRLSMRQIVEILRLAREQGCGIRLIAVRVGLPHSTVGDYLRRFAAIGLPWPLPPELDHAVVEARLFARAASSALVRPLPDWPTIHQELQRNGVTLEGVGVATQTDICQLRWSELAPGL